MKRLEIVILALMLSLFMTACSDENIEIGNSSEEKVTESPTEEITEDIKPEIRLKLNETGLEISDIQTIQGDFIDEFKEEVSRKYTASEKSAEDYIVVQDFDFDGYEDLFIPTVLLTANIPGVYYRYNPDVRLFEEWEQLNEIGTLLSVRDDNMLECHIKGSAVDHKDTVYRWDNGILKPISREVQYASGSEIYIDTFEYDENGNKIQTKRERVILDDNNNWLGTEEAEIEPIPQSCDFLVNGDGVDVIKDGKVIQTLECNYKPDENKIEFHDYDFDGYDDLFISMEDGAMYAYGTYFRYNPDTKLYDKWDELNKIGREMIANEQQKYLQWSKSSEDYWRERFKYRWEDNSLVMFEHMVSDTGEEWNIYSVDSDGNEILSETRDIPDRPIDNFE